MQMLSGPWAISAMDLWPGPISLPLLCWRRRHRAILEDYEQQKKEGKNPVFDPAKFGIEDETGAWKRK